MYIILLRRSNEPQKLRKKQPIKSLIQMGTETIEIVADETGQDGAGAEIEDHATEAEGAETGIAEEDGDEDLAAETAGGGARKKLMMMRMIMKTATDFLTDTFGTQRKTIKLTMYKPTCWEL